MPYKAVYNTKQRGTIYYLIVREDDLYIGICLNLDIIEYGKDPKKLEKSIEEAAKSYVAVVRKKNLSDDYLNKPAPKKYLDLFRHIEFYEDCTRKKNLPVKELKNKYLRFSSSPYFDQNFLT